MDTGATASTGFDVTLGNKLVLSLQPDSREEADRLFEGLSAGALAEMPLQGTFRGGYYGSLTACFGING